MNTHIHKF